MLRHGREPVTCCEKVLTLNQPHLTHEFSVKKKEEKKNHAKYVNLTSKFPCADCNCKNKPDQKK